MQGAERSVRIDDKIRRLAKQVPAFALVIEVRGENAEVFGDSEIPTKEEPGAGRGRMNREWRGDVGGLELAHDSANLKVETGAGVEREFGDDIRRHSGLSQIALTRTAVADCGRCGSCVVGAASEVQT